MQLEITCEMNNIMQEAPTDMENRVQQKINERLK
jgi:hypothetical protein